MKPHPNPALLTVSEAGRELGVSRQMVYKLINKGSLPKVVRHRHVYVPMAAIRDRRERLGLGEEGDGLMSVQAVAAHFGVSTKSVYRWHAAGLLVGKQSHWRTLRFTPADVETFTPPPVGRPRNE